MGSRVRRPGTLQYEGRTMRFWLCVGILIASTASAYAGAPDTPAVPEIDALSRLAALGVVGSIAALIWERRRK